MFYFILSFVFCFVLFILGLCGRVGRRVEMEGVWHVGDFFVICMYLKVHGERDGGLIDWA